MKEVSSMKNHHAQEINKFQMEKQMDFEWIEKNYTLMVGSMKKKIAAEIENVLDFFLNKIEIYTNTRTEEFEGRLGGVVAQIGWMSKRLAADREGTRECFLKLTQKFAENGLSGVVPENPRVQDIFEVGFLMLSFDRSWRP